ncbi:hypothetical protein HY249_03465 [Candidatus Azambacteria bacterium]|nr:hypothetical protein [Candidatus Azambacteria bacterium]
MNIVIMVLLVGLIFVAYIFGSSQGFSNGKTEGINEGKEMGKIEILEAQRKAAEEAIAAAQDRLKNDQNKPAASVKNPLEDTLTKPFGASVPNPLK